MPLRSIKDIEVSGKKILVRVDFNVPFVNGVINDARRIKAAIPTIMHLLNNGAVQVRLATHVGRPNHVDAALSTQQFLPLLRQLIGSDMAKVELLENLRFWPGELANGNELAANITHGMDYYVNEAFPDSHRKHASIVRAAELLPAYGGMRLMEEVASLEKLQENPERPYVVVLGGAKVEDKSSFIDSLLNVADKILVGGKLGFSITTENEKIIKAIDHHDMFDIGPKTVSLFCEELSKAKTIFWNGNLGKSEDPAYAQGTHAIASYIAGLTSYRVVGGGDTLAAIDSYGLAEKFSFVSTGGGATLQFLSGKRLPGLEVLGYYNS